MLSVSLPILSTSGWLRSLVVVSGPGQDGSRQLINHRKTYGLQIHLSRIICWVSASSVKAVLGVLALGVSGTSSSGSSLHFFFIVVQIQLPPFSYHHFSPPHPLPPPTLHPSPLWLCPWVLYTCSLMNLSLLSPVNPLPSPLRLLSLCSLFQCLWLYFACLFVLLIRFHL